MASIGSVVPLQRVGPRGQDVWSTIVGVADDARLPGAHGDLQGLQLYVLATGGMVVPAYVVRFRSIPSDVESLLRQAVQRVEPAAIARRVRIADDYVREAIAPTRFALVLLGAFSMVAIGLAAIGLYGAISYSVTLRTREIGIRVALGASPSSVTGLVVGEGFRLAAIGLVLGAIVSVAATRAVASLLDSVQSADALTFGGVIGLVSAVTLLAAYLPARRAASIDPVEALRVEG